MGRRNTKLEVYLPESQSPKSFADVDLRILCIAESLTRLPCVINTTFREKIYIRWCCIDRLSSQALSECGPQGSTSCLTAAGRR
jgi:hypothetical protein